MSEDASLTFDERRIVSDILAELQINHSSWSCVVETLQNGVNNGPRKTYDSNHTLRALEKYKGGYLHGTQITYSKMQEVVDKAVYVYGYEKIIHAGEDKEGKWKEIIYRERLPSLFDDEDLSPRPWDNPVFEADAKCMNFYPEGGLKEKSFYHFLIDERDQSCHSEHQYGPSIDYDRNGKITQISHFNHPVCGNIRREILG